MTLSRFFPFKLSRCSRTGLALWLGVGLLIVLMIWYPGRRDQMRSGDVVVVDENSPTASQPHTTPTPREGIVRTSSQ